MRSEPLSPRITPGTGHCDKYFEICNFFPQFLYSCFLKSKIRCRVHVSQKWLLLSGPFSSLPSCFSSLFWPDSLGGHTHLLKSNLPPCIIHMFAILSSFKMLLARSQSCVDLFLFRTELLPFSEPLFAIVCANSAQRHDQQCDKCLVEKLQFVTVH